MGDENKIKKHILILSILSKTQIIKYHPPFARNMGDYATVHVLQNYDPGQNCVGSQMIGAKSVYIPEKVIIKYNNKGITSVITEPNTLAIVDKMVEQKTPEFYRFSLKIPKKLAKELVTAARKLDQRGKSLVVRVQEAEEENANKK